MSDDKLIHPPTIGAENGHAPSETGGIQLAPWAEPEYGLYPHHVEEESGIDIRRYALALLRYKWLFVLALAVGVAGGYGVWISIEPTYMAEGNLWIEGVGDPRRAAAGDVAPIRASGLLETSNAWIELLRSYSVLDSVVVKERLYVNAPREYAPAFASLAVADQYYPGQYELRVGESGQDFVLVTSRGALVQQGDFGQPIGENIGLVWQPSRGSFPPGVTVPFTVMTFRDAARSLADRLLTTMQRDGNFLGLRLEGSDPEKIASILNAVMDQHVAVAADLKRNKLDETLRILEEQLQSMELELARSESELEEFRVRTISLPSDQATPIAPGLEITRDPVIGRFFDMKVQAEELQRDRTRLQAALDEFARDGSVRIATLEMIPPAASSSELRRILDELVDARSELRALRDRYSDEYPPIQDALATIRTIETDAIPRVVQQIIDQLSIQEGQVQGYVNRQAADLAAIPPRQIEEGRLERRVEITGTLYNEIRSRVETARLAAASAIPDVRILDRATAPQRPAQDRRLLFMAAILFGCVGLAAGGAILLDRADARYRYASDVGRDIGIDILGSVPRIETGRGRKGVLNAAQALEAFRELRIHVGFAFGSAGPITLTVTSPSAGEGKSLIASNLAVAFAEIGRRTLLIDGDTRRGDAHRLLARERTPGLVDYLKERANQDIIQATDHANLDFIGSGARGLSTPELLASPRMAYFMGTLKRTYDVIIVDSPPLASGGDPLILSSLTGHLALVIRTGATEKGLTHAKLDQLSRLPIRVLGAILNDVSASDAYNSYYASYLPGYEPVPEDDDDPVGSQLLSGSARSGEPRAG